MIDSEAPQSDVLVSALLAAEPMLHGPPVGSDGVLIGMRLINKQLPAIDKLVVGDAGHIPDAQTLCKEP